MATIRVILYMMSGEPLGSFEVSESQEHGCLVHDDELAIMVAIGEGLELARTRELEDCHEDYDPKVDR